ncbi:MAG: M28 family peptidase [Anaerolineales bacterium]|nr:M28 family peptidase [Anaerolineales bacterium]
MRIATNIIKQNISTSILKQLLLLLAISLILISSCTSQVGTQESPKFDAQRAFRDLEYQVGLGPRVIGSPAHEGVRLWVTAILEEAGWDIENQSLNYRGQDLHNIIAKREIGDDFPWVIVGAHYDSRIIADKDPMFENRSVPVPGANDGASGVALLNELARVIPADFPANIWLVYFDAEDNGSMPGGEWILGSRAFVEYLEGIPDAVVIVDMVADQELNIFIEKNSDINLVEEVWTVAENLGHSQVFIDQPKHRIIDDHLPFMQAGIAAVDIIDFDYPYWHTISDTIDQVSAESLGIVGEVVLEWLMGNYGEN